ncbi:hypothetical protein [Caproicibacter fermentans]|uniref:hypothetical protein n=1 Tax=Caproicibacter fermentans TaxID=2576756 RepID=UPI0012EDDF45|nr:hypothetical protein [Caproicibacter fermentans]
MKTKRMVSFLLLISMVSAFLVFPANAAEKGVVQKYNTNGGITIKSTLPVDGPTDGAIAADSYSGSRYGDLSTASKCAALVAAICGYGSAAKAFAKAAPIIANLDNIGAPANVYYVCTEYYTDETEMYYYYKYDFYSDPSHSNYLGSSYTSIITKWY